MSEVSVESVSAAGLGRWAYQNGNSAGAATAAAQSEAPAAVAQFLQENAFLNDLLVEIRDRVSKVFGAATSIRLDLLDDPDFLGEPKLYAVILTPLAAESALALQARLDDEWWLDNLERARGKLNIYTECV